MTSDRKKPGVAFWATVVLVAVLVGYPLSFGPACWLTSYTNIGAEAISRIYRPITWTFGDPEKGATPIIGRAFQGYAMLASRPSWDWKAIVGLDSTGTYGLLYWTWDGLPSELGSPTMGP
jgi:hypothetical protein